MKHGNERIGAERYQLLTIPQTARRLQVSVSSVRRWIVSGSLRCVRIGRVVRISLVDLGYFIDQHRSDGGLSG